MTMDLRVDYPGRLVDEIVDRVTEPRILST